MIAYIPNFRGVTFLKVAPFFYLENAILFDLCRK
jgi:hypothetical protein